MIRLIKEYYFIFKYYLYLKFKEKKIKQNDCLDFTSNYIDYSVQEGYYQESNQVYDYTEDYLEDVQQDITNEDFNIDSQKLIELSEILKDIIKSPLKSGMVPMRFYPFQKNPWVIDMLNKNRRRYH